MKTFLLLFLLSLSSCGLFNAHDGENVSSEEIAEFGRFLSLINGYKKEGILVRVTILSREGILGEATFDLLKLQLSQKKVED